jgi:hypothetical protein
MVGINSTNGEIYGILVVERTRKRNAVAGGRKILKLIQRKVLFVLRSSSQPHKWLLGLELPIKFLLYHLYYNPSAREIFYAKI